MGDEIILALARSHPETDDLLSRQAYDQNRRVGVRFDGCGNSVIGVVQRRHFFGSRYQGLSSAIAALSCRITSLLYICVILVALIVAGRAQPIWLRGQEAYSAFYRNGRLVIIKLTALNQETAFPFPRVRHRVAQMRRNHRPIVWCL